MARLRIEVVHKAKVSKKKKKKKNSHSESNIIVEKPVSSEEKEKKSPYDQFLGATQRTADSHKTACEQLLALFNVL